jgi:hypothetical protein
MTTFIDELKAVKVIGQIEGKFARFRSYRTPPERDLYHSVITYVKNQKERLVNLAQAEGKSLDDFLTIDDQKFTFEDWVDHSVQSGENGNEYTVYGAGSSWGFLYQGQQVSVKGGREFPQIRYLDNLLSGMTAQLEKANDVQKTKKVLQHLQEGLQSLGYLAQIERVAKPGCGGLTNLYAFIN